MAELLVWPALLGYGEARSPTPEAARPGGSARSAIWGVRIGWLAQTALLVVQARRDGFPWGTWAGALNLFVWLVVTGYLVWGCTPRYRLLGLAVMPLAAALLVARLGGGGTGVTRDTGAGCSHCHVGLMLAAFAASPSRPRSPSSTSGRSGGSSAATRACCACACRRSSRSTGSRAHGRARRCVPHAGHRRRARRLDAASSTRDGGDRRAGRSTRRLVLRREIGSRAAASRGRSSSGSRSSASSFPDPLRS
jgi:hypothetical protein